MPLDLYTENILFRKVFTSTGLLIATNTNIPTLNNHLTLESSLSALRQISPGFIITLLIT
jgi:hypothetical protein